MSEKFSLEWNDHQSAWRRSLSELRTKEDFADVTLVAEDKLKFSAHKILLSTSSNTLKFILKDNIHPKPLLFLSGVNSENLGFILDYIYCGEVKLYQEQLASFLDCAKKLEIMGLEGVNHDRTPFEEQNSTDLLETDKYLYEEPEAEEKNVKLEITTPSEHERRNSRGPFKDLVFNAISMSKEEIAMKRRELYQKVDGSWVCLACEYDTKDASNIRKHSEKHIEGLSVTCKFCNRKFTSRSNLYSHMNPCRMHKSKNNKI